MHLEQQAILPLKICCTCCMVWVLRLALIWRRLLRPHVLWLNFLSTLQPVNTTKLDSVRQEGFSIPFNEEQFAGGVDQGYGRVDQGPHPTPHLSRPLRENCPSERRLVLFIRWLLRGRRATAPLAVPHAARLIARAPAPLTEQTSTWRPRCNAERSTDRNSFQGRTERE